jgi:hypothetical protein
MSSPYPTMQSVEAEITRVKNEAIRIRADAGKAIVATVFRGVVPLGVCGIACGATTIIIERANPSLHLVGLLIVWIAATLISATSVIGSVMENQNVNLRRLFGGQPSTPLEAGEARKLFHSIQE